MKAVSFIVGILVGMVLLVVAVGGAVLVTASVVTVGQIENSVGSDVIDDNSDVNNKTLLDLATDLIKDFGDPSSLTINLFREKYGLKIPAEISGIDISVLFDYPISEVANHLGDVVNNMTLRDVGEFLEMDFSSYGLKVLDDNLDNPVNIALDNVLKSIDSSAMTLYTLERDFGITLGENRLFDELYYTPMSEFGGVLDYLPVGTLTGADSDLFLPVGENTVFVSVDRYEEVETGEISLVKDGAETYVAGADENGLIRRELRFTLNSDGVYTVDNSCYDADYDGTGTYYRHVTSEAYDGTQDGELFVKAYLNNVSLNGTGWSLVYDSLFPLNALYTDDTLSATVADSVSGGTVRIDGTLWLNSAAEGETAVAEAVAVFGLPEGTAVDANTRLEEKKDDVTYTAEHVRVHVGTSDQAIQIIAGVGVNGLNNVTDKITSLKLGEVLDITDDSAKILRTLKDTTINKLSDALDTIVLSDATDIILDEYTPAADGAYVYVDGYYTLYNPSRHEGMQRYDKTAVDGSASAALQRLANVAIPDISAAFSKMVLADALAVSPDTYAEVAAPVEGHTYYVFNATYGYPERITYSASEHAGLAVFERTSEGDSNTVLKQLAYVAIDDVSAAMDGIIGSTLLSDIIDVFRYTKVKDYTSGEAGWLIGYNPYFTEGSGDDVTRYAYVYNGDGNYYKTDFFYFAVDETANAGWLKEDGAPRTYSYAQISDMGEFATALSAQNVYVKEADGTFRSNPALVSYYAAKYRDSLLDNCTLYKRVEGVGEGQSTASVYFNGGTDGGLYVKYFNKYYRYNPENPAHWGEPLYFKFTGGYYPASADTATETKYYYDFSSGTFIEQPDSDTASDTTSAVAFAVKMPDSKDGYYYTEISSPLADGDDAFTDGTPVYSKRECETVYKEYTAGTTDDYQKDPSNRFVEIDGEFVPYDESAHAGMTVYVRYIAYIGNDAANDGGYGNLAALSSIKVEIVTEKSSAVLLAIAERGLTLNTLDENIKSFTIEELMDIEEGSIFDDPDIRSATVDTLATAITSKFSTMSISELIRWANVRGVDEQVLFILEDVKIADFFTSLEYNNGTITVNMEKLLGVTTTP